MRSFRALVVLALLSAALIAPASRSGAIVYGTVVDAKAVPFTAALLLRSRPNPNAAQICGAQYVDQYWALTAAHCVVGIPASNLQVASSFAKLADVTAADRHDVVEKIVNPGFVSSFDAESQRSDVAMLRLASPVPASSVIPLNTDPNFPTLGAPVTAYGWGQMNLPDGTLGYPSQLHAGAMTDFAGPTGPCGAWKYDPHLQLCAAGRLPGTPRIVTTCRGDSGGPLVATTPTGPRLVGVTSFGDPLCGVTYILPDVFSRISAFVPWITSVIATTPHVSIADATVTEGNPAYGNKTMHFTVSLDRAVNAPVYVDYTTVDGNATHGSDFRAETGTVTIPAGDISRRIGITIISDRVHEPFEGFFVQLSNPRVARFGRAAAVGWITDND